MLNIFTHQSFILIKSHVTKCILFHNFTVTTVLSDLGSDMMISVYDNESVRYDNELIWSQLRAFT